MQTPLTVYHDQAMSRLCDLLDHAAYDNDELLYSAVLQASMLVERVFLDAEAKALEYVPLACELPLRVVDVLYYLYYPEAEPMIIREFVPQGGPN